MRRGKARKLVASSIAVIEKLTVQAGERVSRTAKARNWFELIDISIPQVIHHVSSCVAVMADCMLERRADLTVRCDAGPQRRLRSPRTMVRNSTAWMEAGYEAISENSS